MGDRTEVPTVSIKEARENLLGSSVLSEFDLRCSQLLKRIVEQRSDPSDTNESEIEIEGRLGFYDDTKRAFVPGVSKKFFKGMRDHFEKRAREKSWFRADDRSKLVEFQMTDRIDVQFEDGVRVTCEVIKDDKTNFVKQVNVEHVITKRRLGRPMDFKVDAPQHGTRIHLRLGVACEEQIPKSSEHYVAHASAAKKAIFDAFNVSTRLKILGGIEINLRKEIDFAYIRFPPNGELAARGKMGLADPIYAQYPDGKLPGGVARQMKWTLAQPSRLPNLKGGKNPELRPNGNTLNPYLFLTNLPGVLTLPDNSAYAVYACQYVIEVRREDILCGHGRFANVSASSQTDADGEEDHMDSHDSSLDSAPDLPIKVYRRKRRWSFLLRRNQRLDMTETQQATNPVVLAHEVPVYEVEIEKILSSTGCRDEKPENLAADLKAVYHTDAFLQDIASRIYGYTLKPLDIDDHPPTDAWAQVREADKQRKETLLQDLSRLDSTSTGIGKPASLQPQLSRQDSKQEFTDQADAADFYNQLNRSSQAERSRSLIYHMRCLNNFVKSVVLKETLNEVRLECNCTQFSVLDLACGKGADIQKLVRSCKELDRSSSIRLYVGVDIARKSLDDAVERLQSMRDRPAVVKFIEADLGSQAVSSEQGGEDDFKSVDQWSSDEPNWKRKPPSETLPLNTRFDLVTMQFALHYMFQNMQRAHHFFRMISRHTNVGGRFIATTVHADEMVRRLMSSGPGKSSFSIYDQTGIETCHVAFEEDFRKRAFSRYSSEGRGHEPFDEMVGIRYNFTLRDGEDDSQQAVAAPEWLVPPHLLLKLATVYSFELKRYERLPNAAARHMAHDFPGALFRRMNVLNHEGSISDAEWDIASLYVVVELRREPKPENAMEALQRLKYRVRNYNDLPEEERNTLLSTLLSLPH